MNGILNIFKPEGITSYGVINELKKTAGHKKIGHTGTLDPLAKGVLPLFLGKMTKLIPLFNMDDKIYQAVARLGGRSVTLDREGEIVPVPVPSECDEELIRRTLSRFEGEIEQTPPIFSAVKVKGRKLYQYARKGLPVKVPSRKVVIHAIEEMEYSYPDVSFKVHCSKGVYIRSLVDDFARALGTGGYLLELTRIQCGRFFNIKNSLNFEQVKKIDKTDLQKYFIDPQCILPERHVIRVISMENQTRIRQGRLIRTDEDQIEFSPEGKSSPQAMAKNGDDELIALGSLEFSQDSYLFKPSKVFI